MEFDGNNNNNSGNDDGDKAGVISKTTLLTESMIRYPNIDRVCRESVAASKPACDKIDKFVRALGNDTALAVVRRCLECSVVQPNSTWMLRDLLSRTVWDNLFEVVLSVRTRDACLAELHVRSTDCAAFDTLRADGVLDSFFCRAGPQLRMEVAAQVAQSGAPASDWHTRGNFYSDPAVLYDMVYESGLRRFCQRLSNDLLRRVCEDATRREPAVFAHQIERDRVVDAIVKSFFGQDGIADRAAHDALRRAPGKNPRRGASMLFATVDDARPLPPPIGHGQHRTCLRAAQDVTIQPVPFDL